jgi:hypothetical protein
MSFVEVPFVMTSTLTPPARWTDEFLDSMRQVTDPEADRLVADLYAEGGIGALLKLKSFLDAWDAPAPPELAAPVREFFERPVEYPPWVDFEKIRLAEDLFVSYGPVTTVTLLLNAVPHFFTNPAGARSFYLAKIFSPDSVRNRMHEVPQFVINITQHGGLSQRVTPGTPPAVEKGPGVLTAQKLRVAHARIRLLLKLHQQRSEDEWDLGGLGEPINQEDLAEALMYFCLWTIEGLEKVGFDQTPEEEEAMLMSWKTVGFLLGLREELQPKDVAEALVLRDTIARRQTRVTPEARALIAEMLGIVRGMLPIWHRHWPAGLMRYQLGNELADSLGVPNHRLLGWLLTVTHPFWGERQVFAKLAKLLSPPVVRWLVTQDRKGNRGAFHIPARLARSWGLKSSK